MDADRQQLLARFTAYLEAAGEPELEDDAPDLFSLLAELAALKNETRLQTRQVKEALDQFRGVFDTLQQSNDRLAGELDRNRERQAAKRQEADRGLLLELLDLRDRLDAGVRQAQRYRPGWLARRAGTGELLAGMAEGVGMSLRRLDDILARRGVQPVVAQGRTFDPATMHAAETERRTDLPDAVVLQEVRPGFLHHGRLLRAAEVVVNKRENDG
jgi:molecular chaperone GrpE